MTEPARRHQRSAETADPAAGAGAGPPPRREAVWGFVFISPVARSGSCCSRLVPMVAVPGPVSSPTSTCADPDEVQFIGLDNYVRMLERPERRRSPSASRSSSPSSRSR